jgi:protein subunit release factor B
VVIVESDITEAFLKGSGPGGQKINKTSSAVQLKHLPTGIVVKCQETRSRAQNRKLARRILGDRLEEMEKGPQSRTALKAERERKKKASASKKSKRKYRKLENGSAGTADEEDVDVEAKESGDTERLAENEGILQPDQPGAPGVK